MMQHKYCVSLLACIVLYAHAAYAREEATEESLTMPQCVAIALSTSANIGEAKARVQEFEARLAEVESVYYPKLYGYGFVAPMFTVHGSGYNPHIVRKWDSLHDFGPYTYLELLLATPLYTFGRVEAGEKAASNRADVERARLREARHMVVLEVRRLYYMHVFAQSMLPVLNQASDALKKAHKRAQAMFDSSSGDVTQVELSKLEFGLSEVDRYVLVAQDSMALAAAALQHTMGRATDVAFDFADKVLAAPDEHFSIPPLPVLLQQAAEHRPEWAELEHGKNATLALAQAEKLANWPVVFLAGQFRGAYTPTRDSDSNPYHYDVYNLAVGGVALGLQFNVDPALSAAKEKTALAMHAQVDALARFAATGIPLQVRKAYDELQRAKQTDTIAAKGLQATRKWMTFAATAYESGTGEARDLLEGLAAYVEAKRTYYENLQAFYIAQAELDYAIGHIEWGGYDD